MKTVAIIAGYWVFVLGLVVLTYAIPLAAALVIFVLVTGVGWLVASDIVDRKSST